MAENGLKAICDLMGMNFRIPHYQRGYRWEDQEVTELLDDLWAFQKEKESGDFYCLQPIVLQQNEERIYDVLDGQQRLTTIYLILVYLEERRKEDNYIQPLFTIDYTTREECRDFLKEKKFFSETIDSSNIDFFYICKAFQCIDKWFNDEQHSGLKSKLLSILLDKTDKGNRNVKVIRYDVEPETNPIDVFIRLNIGKIPLTDAELTKALLLQSDKYPPEELEFNKMKLHSIASEWDMIETTLQEKAFWFFLNDKSNTKDTHIEFIFDLLARKINTEQKYYWNKEQNKPKLPRKHATFLVFSKHLEHLIELQKFSRIKAVEHIWSAVTEYFEFFKEWFQNRTLYHYIGFLISRKSNNIIDSLIRESKKVSKSRFKDYLEREISSVVKIRKPLNELVYEDGNGRKADYQSILLILLLHNVHTTLKSDKEKPRFPFELYKNESWSLEHIYARNSQPLNDTKKQKEWLYDHIQSLSSSNSENTYPELLVKMNELINQEEIVASEFEDLEEEVYEAIDECFEFGNDENVHLIKNLCLLDKATNSLLNNSVFDVKREKIQKRELEGYFIPVCTKNVFLKSYTSYPKSNAYWTKADRNEYFEDVENTYNFFIKKLEV